MTKRLALSLGLRDRNDLAERSIEPLLHDDIDLFLIDGSSTEKGRRWAEMWAKLRGVHVHTNVTGGADAYICYALATMLKETEAPYVGLCENDVLLHRDWPAPTLALFERGRAEGLEVGAVSARCYEDRILCQRNGFALMHNLGAGHVIFSRRAAGIVLNYCRTHWTTSNVKTFHALSGVDIRKYWAFRGNSQAITHDWGIDTILAAHGLASLALTPTDVTMLDQDVAAQGLKLATEPVEWLRNDLAFDRFAAATHRIRAGEWRLPDPLFLRLDDGSQMIFPHQIGALGANEHGDWRMKWKQGFGPFAYVSDPQEHEPPPTLDIPISGPCELLLSGGATGGKVRVVDTHSGYEIEPDLPPEGDTQQTLQLPLPPTPAWRAVRITALTPGVVFCGVKTREPQPLDPTWMFDPETLPRPA